ncbi:MAG TPA: hypothetical protein VJT73_17615 [Polyangiaceae bacterium]|nr:hypothetical protein [Polyangiaceae bacterium]
MTTAAGALCALAAVFVGSMIVRSPRSAPSRKWTFTEPGLGASGLGLAMPASSSGIWLLDDHPGASGERALVNLAGDPGERAAVAVVDAEPLRDARVTARCKAAGEGKSSSCGVVLRYGHAQGYYVVRVEKAPPALVFAAVSPGSERAIQTKPVDLRPADWHVIEAEVRGDHIVARLDGRAVIDARDQNLPGPGAVGLWAPSEGIAYFDEMTVAPLTPAIAHPVDMLPILLQQKARR